MVVFNSYVTNFQRVYPYIPYIPYISYIPYIPYILSHLPSGKLTLLWKITISQYGQVQRHRQSEDFKWETWWMSFLGFIRIQEGFNQQNRWQLMVNDG